jgi:hypothetical protein
MFTPHDYILWLTGWLLRLAIVAVMLQRGHHLRFPWFFALQCFLAAKTVVLFGISLSNDPLLYSRVYWPLGFIAACVCALAIKEIFLLDGDGMRFAVSVLFAISLAMAATCPASGPTAIAVTTRTIERSLLTVVAGLFLWSRLADRPAFATKVERLLALGIMADVSVALLKSALIAFFGVQGRDIFRVLSPIAGLFVLPLWLYAMAQRCQLTLHEKARLANSLLQINTISCGLPPKKPAGRIESERERARWLA